MGLSQRDYAAHRKARGLRGTTLKAVQDALAAGRIKRGPDGKIDPDESDRLWQERTTIRVSQRPQRAAKVVALPGKRQPPAKQCTPGGTRAEAAAEPVDPKQRSADDSYFEAQRQREWIRLEKENLELEAKRCQLVPLVPINAYVAGMIIKIRDELGRIGPELRDRLAQETDPIACEEMIVERIQRALADMAEYRPETQ